MSPSLLVSCIRGSLLALATPSLLATTGAAQACGAILKGQVPAWPLSSVLDSAALVRDLAVLPAPELPQGVPPLFGVSFDSTGAWLVKARFGQIPASYADPVVAAIQAHLSRQPHPLIPLYVVLRVVAGPEPVVAKCPPLEEQMPEFVNRREIMRLLNGAASRSGRSLSRPVYRAEVRFRVLPVGTADLHTVDFVYSTGEADLDREATAVVGRMRFRSATVEGVPVPVWVTLPITFYFVGARLAVSEVADSVGLVRAVAGLPAPELPSGVRPIFRVAFDSAGAVAEVEPAFDQIPASYAGPVAAAIRASLKPGPAQRGVHTYLRVVAGRRAVVERRSPEQVPELLNESVISRMAREAVRRAGARPVEPKGPPGIGRVRLRVLADGTVDPESVTLVHWTGDPGLRAETVSIARQMSFEPARLYGIPVQTWDERVVVFWPPLP